MEKKQEAGRRGPDGGRKRQRKLSGQGRTRAVIFTIIFAFFHFPR